MSFSKKKTFFCKMLAYRNLFSPYFLQLFLIHSWSKHYHFRHIVIIKTITITFSSGIDEVEFSIPKQKLLLPYFSLSCLPSSSLSPSSTNLRYLNNEYQVSNSRSAAFKRRLFSNYKTKITTTSTHAGHYRTSSNFLQ